MFSFIRMIDISWIAKWENEMKILFDAIHGVNDEVDDTQYVLKILHCVAKICSRQVTSLALPMKRLENSILEQFMPLIKKLKKLTTIKLDFYNSLGTNASQESLSLLRNLSLEIARSRDSSLKELHLRGKILDSKSNDTLLSIFDPEIYACWETVDFAIDSIVHELDIKSSPFEGESSMKKLAVHESFLPITHLQHCKIFQGIKYLELSNYVFPEKHTEAILNLLESSDLTEFTLHDIHFERNLTFELMLVSLLKAKNLLKIHFDAVEVYNFMQIDWELLFRNQQGLDELIISRMWQNSSFNLYHEILKSGEKIPCSHVGNRNLRPNRKLGHFALNRGFIEPEYLVYLYKFPCDHLDLSYNSLFSRFKDVHLNNMIQCTKVNHLDLSGNRLGSLNLSLFEATWNILISSECLQHLVLQNNLIHSKHLKILVSGLRVRNSRFQKLQVLDLRENFLTYIDLNSTSSSENLNAFPKISDLVESLFLNTERVLVPVSDCLSQTSWAEVQTMSRMS